MAMPPVVSMMIERVQRAQTEAFDEQWKQNEAARKLLAKQRDPAGKSINEMLDATVGKMEELLPDEGKKKKEPTNVKAPATGPVGDIPPPPLGDD
jgi:hypothetical protein